MSFLSDIRNKAKSFAKGGLERVGINVPDIPEDDEDTSERDFLDIYFEKTQNENIMPIIHRIKSVPENLRQPLRDIFIPYCGDDIGSREAIQNWIDHREDMEFADNSRELSMDVLKKEGLGICERTGVIKPIAEDRLACIQSIARAQKRPIVNLLRIASGQCDADSLQDWIDQMNTKLEKFDLSIVRIDMTETMESMNSDKLLYTIVGK